MRYYVDECFNRQRRKESWWSHSNHSSHPDPVNEHMSLEVILWIRDFTQSLRFYLEIILKFPSLKQSSAKYLILPLCKIISTNIFFWVWFHFPKWKEPQFRVNKNGIWISYVPLFARVSLHKLISLYLDERNHIEF